MNESLFPPRLLRPKTSCQENWPWQCTRKRSRHGSFLLIALGILVCLVLFSVSYFNYMMMQTRLSDRMGKEGVLAKTATAIATLAIHKMQFGPLLNENSGGPFPEKKGDSECLYKLFSELGEPVQEMQEALTGEINLAEISTCDLHSILEHLIKPLTGMGEFSYRIHFLCQRKDFEESGTPGYPREKKGCIRLMVRTSLKKGPGQEIAETFSYKCRVKVAAALTPGLSKFTLYIEQAGAEHGRDFFGYNRVGVTEMGDLDTSSPAKPLVLNNDGKKEQLQSANSSPEVDTTFDAFVQRQRGLVYLGGNGNVILNLARSDRGKPDANSGEGFHFFRLPNGDGFRAIIASKTSEGEIVTVSQMEQGVSNSRHEFNRSFYDLLASESKTIWPIFRDDFKIEMSSLFRLFGVQGNRSPTLVLDNVKAQNILARMYEYPPLANPPWSKKPPREKLYLYDDPAVFTRETRAESGKLVPLVKAGLIGDQDSDLLTYLRTCGSFVASRAYNLGLAYMYNQNVRDPWTSFPATDKLQAFITNSATEQMLHEMPEPFATGGLTSLKKMDPFLQIFENRSRCGYVIEFPTVRDPDFWAALQKRGLLLNNVLSLSGWILVRSPGKKLVIDRELRILGNGGIIFEEGDIEISQSIRPLSNTRNRVILQIVARKGNIRLSTPDQALIQAALVANGKIIFSNQEHLTVNGAMAMRRLFDQVNELDTFPGGYLSYFPLLSAMPKKLAGPAPVQATSEKPLLSYQFELLPILTD